MQQLGSSHAGLVQALGSASEVVIQEEVDGRVDAAVDEGEAARDEEPVRLHRTSFATQVDVPELWTDYDDFEDVEGQPWYHKGHYDR